MKTKIYTKGLCSFNIKKESGNLHIKDRRDGNHKPVQYAAYINNEEMLDLRSYMNITEKTIEEAIEDLTQEGVVLVGHRFDIYFYDKEGVKVFIETMDAKELVL